MHLGMDLGFISCHLAEIIWEKKSNSEYLKEKAKHTSYSRNLDYATIWRQSKENINF